MLKKQKIQMLIRIKILNKRINKLKKVYKINNMNQNNNNLKQSKKKN